MIWRLNSEIKVHTITNNANLNICQMKNMVCHYMRCIYIPSMSMQSFLYESLNTTLIQEIQCKYLLKPISVTKNISPSANRSCSSVLNGSDPEQMSEQKRMKTLPACHRHLECCFDNEPIHLQSDQTCKHIKATKT